MALVSAKIYSRLKRALAALGFVVRTSSTSDVTTDPSVSAGAGAASASEPNGSLWLRTNGIPEFRVGSAWKGVLVAGQALNDDNYAVLRAMVTVTAAELRALRATPKTLVAAPGSGYYLEFVAAHVWLDYGTVAHDAPVNAGDDLAFRMTNGSGVIVATQEATGLVNASADVHTIVQPGSIAVGVAQNVLVVENAALVLHNAGAAEYAGTGDGVLKVIVWYRKVTLAPAS